MVTTYVEPKPCNLSFAEISDLAGWFASEIKFSPGNDVLAAVAELGGEIVYEDLWNLKKSDSGSVRVEPDGAFRITLPNHTSKARDRFTVAHELGHWFLHFAIPKNDGTFPEGAGLEAARYGSGQTEYEANWFAAALLMPEAAFSQAYADLGRDIESVAAQFAVSTSAAAVRAKVLRLG